MFSSRGVVSAVCTVFVKGEHAGCPARFRKCSRSWFRPQGFHEVGVYQPQQFFISLSRTRSVSANCVSSDSLVASSAWCPPLVMVLLIFLHAR